jgi:hypothetical protein
VASSRRYPIGHLGLSRYTGHRIFTALSITGSVIRRWIDAAFPGHSADATVSTDVEAALSSDNSSHRPRDVLDALFAQILERVGQLVSDLVSHHSGDADPAGLGERLKASNPSPSSGESCELSVPLSIPASLCRPRQ